MTDFFVSYHQADAAKAELIASALHEAGFSVRFAPWEGVADADFDEWAGEALEDCDRLIAVASPDYFDPNAPRRAFLSTSPYSFRGAFVAVISRETPLPKPYARSLRIHLADIDGTELQHRLIGALTVAQEGNEPSSLAVSQRTFSWGVLIAALSLVFAAFLAFQSEGDLAEKLWKALQSVWVSLAVAILYVVVVWLTNAGLAAPDSRRWITSVLLLDRGGAFYRTTLRHILDWIDKRFAAKAQSRGHGPEHWTVAWSPRLLEVCLICAVFYPTYTVIFVSVSTNDPSMLGETVIVRGDQPSALRFGNVAGLVSALGFLFVSGMFRVQGRKLLANFSLILSLVSAISVSIVSGFIAIVAVLSVGLAVVLAPTVSAMIAVTVAAVISVPLVFSASVGIATVLVGFIIGTLSSNRPLLHVVGEIVLVAVLYVLVSEIVSDVRSHPYFVFVALNAITFGYFYWSGVVINKLRSSLLEDYTLKIQVYFMHIIATLVYISAMVFGVDSFRGQESALLVFLGVLPLMNGVFDFVSIGFTRCCLGRGLKSNFLSGAHWALIDTIGAAVLMFSLVLGVIFVIHFIASITGGPLTDLNAIFLGIAADPGGHWWLYVTFFSTLIPTLLHLGVACFSFLALAPASWQRLLANWVGRMDRDGFANAGARALLPLLVTLSLALPFLALYAVGLWIAEYHQDMGWGLFQIALDFAEWLDPAYGAGVDAILEARTRQSGD